MIKAVFLDIDGVLTDGKVIINSEGEESKAISFDDIDGVFELKRAGMSLGFITGEDNRFAEFVKKRFSPDYFISGSKDKLASFKAILSGTTLSPSEVCFLGDSKKDIELLEELEHSFVPSDVSDDVKLASKRILKAKRGAGAIKELAGFVLEYNAAGGNSFWQEKLLEHINVIKAALSDPATMKNIGTAGDMILECFRAGGKLLICGNGGSASDAQHIATEFVSRFFLERPGIPAEALTTNTSSLTAIGNDYGFDIVFSRQVEAMGKKGDVLLGISTSGNSKNVIVAMKKARELGLRTIGLSGSKEKMEIVDVSDCLIAVPSKITPRIQEGHILIGHMICEYVEKELFS